MIRNCGIKKVEISNCDFIKVLDPLCCAAAVWLKDSPGQQARAMASRAAPAAKNLRSQDLFCQARNLFLMDFFGILGKGIAAL